MNEDQVTINDFAKVEMRVGLVTAADNKEGSEKLIRLTVDVGEGKTRTIFTAVRTFGYTPEYFLNKKFFFLTNIEPKKIMDEYSQGMIVAVESPEKPIFIEASPEMAIGAGVR